MPRIIESFADRSRQPRHSARRRVAAIVGVAAATAAVVPTVGRPVMHDLGRAGDALSRSFDGSPQHSDERNMQLNISTGNVHLKGAAPDPKELPATPATPVPADPNQIGPLAGFSDQQQK